MGGPLENAQHELIALAVIEGKTLAQIADAANYHTKWRESHVCNLIKRPEIQARILELQQQAASDRVMTVRQRLERLSEIGRAHYDDPDRDGDPIRAIHEMNLMQRIYREGTDVNVRQYVINMQVVSEASERATKLIIEGLKTDDNNALPDESEKGEKPPTALLSPGPPREAATPLS